MPANSGVLIPVELATNIQTDVTGGGLSADDAGTFSLNFCNDTDTSANVNAIYLTNGEAPANKHKVHPAFVVENRGWTVIQPIVIDTGWKVFVQSSVAISVQLIGDRRG